MKQNDEQEEVRVTFSLSRAEYVRAVRYYLRKSHLVSWVQAVVLIVALAAAAVMGTLMERMSFLCTLLVVLSAMVALYGVWLYVIQPGRIYDKNPALGRQVSFLFNREDLSRQDEETAVLLDWDLKMLWRSKEFYYLFRGAEGYLLLPRSAFQSEEDRLRFEFLAQTACPEAKVKRFD
ncbi:hypothetical protein [Intestinimonas sp.]|uniref:hypothetical protein n=1 Tax=Intestinimonas sp. TaxID=1965293 RepID=UPI0026346583|nr:hypothetical protein [Intestinimonas sp.]